jgi:hypothetical protein
MEELRKITKTIHQCPDRDLKRFPLKWNSHALSFGATFLGNSGKVYTQCHTLEDRSLKHQLPLEMKNNMHKNVICYEDGWNIWHQTLRRLVYLILYGY